MLCSFGLLGHQALETGEILGQVWRDPGGHKRKDAEAGQKNAVPCATDLLHEASFFLNRSACLEGADLGIARDADIRLSRYVHVLAVVQTSRVRICEQH